MILLILIILYVNSIYAEDSPFGNIETIEGGTPVNNPTSETSSQATAQQPFTANSNSELTPAKPINTQPNPGLIEGNPNYNPTNPSTWTSQPQVAQAVESGKISVQELRNGLRANTNSLVDSDGIVDQLSPSSREEFFSQGQGLDLSNFQNSYNDFLRDQGKPLEFRRYEPSTSLSNGNTITTPSGMKIDVNDFVPSTTAPVTTSTGGVSSSSTASAGSQANNVGDGKFKIKTTPDRVVIITPDEKVIEIKSSSGRRLASSTLSCAMQYTIPSSILKSP